MSATHRKENEEKIDIQQVNIGQLKEMLVELEAKLGEVEGQVSNMKKMKTENETLKVRIENLEKVYFALSWHASAPQSKAIVKMELGIYQNDLNELNSRGKSLTK